MSCNRIDLYLCNFNNRDCNRSPGCAKQGGPCYCTTYKSFAQRRSDGKPIVIDQVPMHDELTEEDKNDSAQTDLVHYSHDTRNSLDRS